MWFSKTELEVISKVGNGNREVSKIAETLKMSQSQVYRISQTLNKKGILALNEGVLQPEMKTHVSLLLKILAHAISLAVPLSGTGIKIYLALLEPKKIEEAAKETGLHKTTIIKKIKQGRRISLLIIDNKTYRVNEKIWQDVREYLIELKKYEETLDVRVPVNSIIYYKTDSEIVFSNKEEIDAEKTAFSAYERFGIKLLGITYNYYLPKKNLTKEEVFKHSLYVAEKEKDIRNLTFIALFLAKYKKDLSHIKHPIVNNLLKVFSGEKIKNYPRLEEIKDRAEVYKIEV
jgi:predicted transcriptional regulator